MRALPHLLTLALLATPLAACLEELPRPSTVDDLRILAVRHEPAEARPGDSVALEALVADPLERPASYAWATCLVPEQGFGFFSGSSETSSSGGNGYGLDGAGSCFDLAAAGAPHARLLGVAPTATLDVPADLFDDGAVLRTAYGLPETVDLPAELEAAFLGVAGVNLTVSLRVSVDGRMVEATKRVNVGLPSVLPDNAANENPGAPAIHFTRKVDGQTPPTDAPPPALGTCTLADTTPPALERGTRYVLAPVNLPDPPPTYAILLGGSTTDAPFELVYDQENAYFSWFATAGDLARDVTKSSSDPSNTWLVPVDAPDALDLWIVVRDGRGGTAWCTSRFAVKDP